MARNIVLLYAIYDIIYDVTEKKILKINSFHLKLVYFFSVYIYIYI